MNSETIQPRIAILHYTAPPIVGGVENVIAQHTRLLANAGYPVTLVVGRGGTDKILVGAHVVVMPMLDSEYPENIEIARALDKGIVPPQIDSLREQIEHALAPILADTDVVIAHNVFNFHFNLPFTTALHCLLDHGYIRQMVAWCHDVSRYVNPHSGVKMRDGFPWDLLRTYRPQVTYVAVSESRQRLLAKILGCSSESICVVPNGVDPVVLLGLDSLAQHLTEQFELLSADLIMLMPVRITRAKNIEFAIQVTAALKAAGVRARLIVTGPPDPHDPDIAFYFDELIAQARELGLSQEIVFLHTGTSKIARPLLLNSTNVSELYRVCDLVLMPSHREGFGMPVLEAGMVGKPVFATAVPVLEKIGMESVYLFEPNESPAHVAARILTWAEQDIAYRLRQRVRQDYTWSSIFARSIEPLLARVVGAQEVMP